MRCFFVLFLLSLGLGIQGCRSGDDPGAGISRAALRAVEGCGDLEELLRESAIAQMREQVMANYQTMLDGEACVVYADYDAAVDGDADTDSDSDGDEGASEYSTTNTQEAGVDEADFVKNDGSYIYMISGASFLILDAWPPEQTEIITTVPIDGQPRLLYVYGDHAVIYADVIDEEADGTRDQCYYDEYSWDYICCTHACTFKYQNNIIFYCSFHNYKNEASK